MDPDMVRQQEEAEQESRLGPATQARAPASAERVARRETSLVLRSEARHDADAEAAAAKANRIGWFAALRASLYCLILTMLGLLGGIMIGVKSGLFPTQSLAIGAGLGVVLGWQSAFASLRASKRLAFGRAMLTAIVPAVIVLACLIGAMLAAFQLTGVSPQTLAEGHLPAFWMIVGGGGVIGVILAASRIRKMRAY